MTALNPVHTVRRQIAESYELHHPEMTAGQVAEASLQMLKDVGIPDPVMHLEEYPHEFSGGMRVPLVVRLHIFPTCLRTHPWLSQKTLYIAPFGNILDELMQSLDINH